MLSRFRAAAAIASSDRSDAIGEGDGFEHAWARLQAPSIERMTSIRRSRGINRSGIVCRVCPPLK
jgi:hypothetical protein